MKFPLSLFNPSREINFAKYFSNAFIFSIIITALSIFVSITKGFNYSIDFTGGLVVDAVMDTKYQKDDIEQYIQNKINRTIEIQPVKNQISGNKSKQMFMIKIGISNEDKRSQITEMKKLIQESVLKFDGRIERIEYIGAKIGNDFLEKSCIALIVSLAGMIIYIWVRFKMEFAIGALVSLAHDAFVTMGFCAITQCEFDGSAVAAILTVLGYSINDSVVIYDRIRESLKKNKIHDLDQLKSLINKSINETLSRTTMTVFSTLIVCFILGFLGGERLHSFSYITMFGIAFGTYSSIFISAPIVLLFQKIYKKNKKYN